MRTVPKEISASLFTGSVPFLPGFARLFNAGQPEAILPGDPSYGKIQPGLHRLSNPRKELENGKM
jgi:hypothetical protein